MRNMCPRHSSCSFLPARSPACPLLPHQLVPMYSLVLGAATSGPPVPPIWSPRPDDQSLCMTDLSPLFTLYLFLSLALGSPQPGKQRARGGALCKHKIKWLPVLMLPQEPCMLWSQPLLPSGLIPYLYNGLIAKGLISSVFLPRQQWPGISRTPFP